MTHLYAKSSFEPQYPEYRSKTKIYQQKSRPKLVTNIFDVPLHERRQPRAHDVYVFGLAVQTIPIDITKYYFTRILFIVLIRL